MISRGRQAVYFIASSCAVFITLEIVSRISDHYPFTSNPRFLIYSESNAYSGWRGLTISEVFGRFKPKTSDSCVNSCDEVRDETCKAKRYEDWNDLISKIEGVPLYQANEYMFPYETTYLGRPPLTDPKTLPDMTKSAIYYVSKEDGRPVKRSLVSCRHMEQLTFRVDFVDGYGKLRGRGGDDVRVWIRENPTAEIVDDFSAAGNVEDLKNGSYLATVTCAWTGKASLRVGLAYPWEYIRAALNVFRTGSQLMLTGFFRNKDGDEEVTMCSSQPNVAGRPCLCNLTRWNELPFFCGKPLNSRLSCKDLAGTQILYPTHNNSLTQVELDLDKRMTRSASDMLVKQPVLISIKKPELPVQQKPCYKVDARVSWSKKYPRGFWSSGGKWQSFLCQQPKLTNEWATKCLQDTNVLLFGDSNMGKLKDLLVDLLKCSAGRAGKYINKENNITIQSLSHEYPFYSSAIKKIIDKVGLRRYVNLIPPGGEHVLIFHYYLHPTRSHPAALYVRLVRLKKTIKMFLNRNPRVQVFIRGIHISTSQTEVKHMMGGDVLGTFHLESFHQVFDDLRDRVFFLDGWDMSIALENAKYHPREEFTLQMIRDVLSYRCR